MGSSFLIHANVVTLAFITDVTWNKDCPHPPAPSPREERGSKIQKILFPSPFGRGARGEGLRSFHVTSVISITHSFVPNAPGEPVNVLRGEQVAIVMIKVIM